MPANPSLRGGGDHPPAGWGDQGDVIAGAFTQPFVRSSRNLSTHIFIIERRADELEAGGHKQMSDVVYLGSKIAPPYMSPNTRGGGGVCGVSANECSCAH